MRFIPYIVMALMAVGGFLYIKNLGKIECENKQKIVYIEAGKKDIEIDKKQANHITRRSSYDRDKRLREGSF